MHMKCEKCFADRIQVLPKGISLKSFLTFLNKLSAFSKLHKLLPNLNLPNLLQELSGSVSES